VGLRQAAQGPGETHLNQPLSDKQPEREGASLAVAMSKSPREHYVYINWRSPQSFSTTQLTSTIQLLFDLSFSSLATTNIMANPNPKPHSIPQGTEL
jgi:hypothetical protein